MLLEQIWAMEINLFIGNFPLNCCAYWHEAAHIIFLYPAHLKMFRMKCQSLLVFQTSGSSLKLA
jgi:hypothetical protein